jgi:hypothetical protein
MGLCLVAVFAMFALWAVSASAASPEYKVCAKNAAGTKYSDKGCTTESAGGKYGLAEWTAATKEDKSKGTHPVNNLVNPATHTVEGNTECKKEKGLSKLIGPKEALLGGGNEYTKCSSAGKTCETPGAGTGKIKTKPLVSVLIPLAAGKVGVLFKPAPGNGNVLAEYNCEGLSITAKFVTIGQIEGLSGAASKSWTVKLQQRGGTPGNLQEFLYPDTGSNGELGEGSAAEEEKAEDFYLQFVPKFEACVKEGVEPGPTGDGESLEAAEATCASEAGTEFFVEEGEPPAQPDGGISSIEPLKVSAPFAQNNTTSNKGSVLKIV